MTLACGRRIAKRGGSRGLLPRNSSVARGKQVLWNGIATRSSLATRWSVERAHPVFERIFRGYHFVTGALMLTLARTGPIDKLSGGLCRSEDFEAVKTHIVEFMAGGFDAICG